MSLIKKISIITIILYMLLITSVFASTATLSVSVARLRKEASVESYTLAKIYEGEKVEILEKNGEWYKVKYKNNVGYLKNSSIKEDLNSSAANTQNKNNTSSNKNTDNTNSDSSKVVTNSHTKLRYQPSMISNEIIQIEAGKELIKNRELGNWIQVSDGTVTGWIIKAKTLSSNLGNLENTEEKDTEKTENKKDSSKKEETETNEIIDNNKNIENNKVKEDNKNIENNKTAQNNKEENNNQSQLANSNKKGKVNVDTAKVRKTASKTAKVVGFLDYNDEITIIAEEGEWYKFTEKDVEGYVHKTLITVKGEENVSSRGTNEERETEKKEEITFSNLEINGVLNEIANNNKATGNKGQEVVNTAKTYLGYKYVVGGKNPETGFDCSGFTRYIYLQYGYSLGATAAGQNNLGTEVSRSDLRPGDLILFYDEAKTKIGHTGIYIGNGDFIHSDNPTRGVVIDNINTNSYYNERYIVAKRIVE